MDLASLLGIVICLALVIFGIVAGNGFGVIVNFLDLNSALITFGGAFCSVMASNTMPDFVAGIKAIGLIFKAQSADTPEVIKKIIDLSNVARKEGLLSLEEAAGDLDDAFLKKGILLIVDGTDPELVRGIMETEMISVDERHKKKINFWSDLGAMGPAWGMIGTLVGLVNMLQAMDDPGAIGPAMAVALITTLYGSLLANWICTPTSAKLKVQNEQEMMGKQIVIEGLLSIQAGEMRLQEVKRMAKRKEDPPPAGAPAWQSTFADLMNLLLCFFVLLFSMSNMDAEKFEALAASFSNTFSIFSGGGSSFDDGLLISNGMSQLNQLDNYITNVGAAANTETMDNEFKEEVDEEESLAAKMEEEGLKESEQMAERIEEALAEVGKEREVDVSFTSQYVLLSLKGSVLFDSGKADLKQEAMPTIAQIGVILERYGLFGIEIEGHTDNVPMNGGKYENNDVLSSYRALSLFNYLTQNTSIDPASIKHSGRGEYAPIADNSTPEGRSKNRRIEIKVYNSLNSLVR